MLNIGLITYAAAAVAFTVLSAVLCLQVRTRWVGITFLLASIATAAWAAVIALGTLAEYPPILALQVAEVLRSAAWLFVLLQLVSIQGSGMPWRVAGRAWVPAFGALFLVLLVFVALPHLAPDALGPLAAMHNEILLVTWLTLALGGLLLIEQLYRNGAASARWSMKYLCLSLGVLFAYDFFMYAEALLFRRLDAQLWQARGLVTAVVTPGLAIGIARSRNWQLNLHISRHVVFHTVTLLGAGIYLLGMAVIGYFIKYLGGSWGGVLQVGFLAASLTLLLSLLFSGKLRAELRVFLSKHFFSYRYDYREEWLKVTQALARLSDNVPEGIIQTMAPLGSSNGGLLWALDELEGPELLANVHVPAPDITRRHLGNLPKWLERTDWVIDLKELRRTPDLYQGLELPDWLQEHETLWLIIPLVFRDHLEGILMLSHSEFKDSLNWEDRDLLKTAGRQAASHLAQHRASNALVEARQFDAFNRLSAYVIHDLKNILAQQSLIVSNATRHRNNPAFIDDMISTVENSVARMQRLMEQMRGGSRTSPSAPVELVELIGEVVASRGVATPAATISDLPEACWVEADRERLATVFNHLLQNAQEATPPSGSVTVAIAAADDWATVTIDDTGRGMDQDFLRERLFRPFDTTKGLTGMGIGAFESREYIRLLGGDIAVTSEAGKGTTFRVTMPSRAPASAAGDEEAA